MATSVKSTTNVPVSEWLEFELNPSYNRESAKIQLNAGQKLESGTPLIYSQTAAAFVPWAGGATPTEKVAILVFDVEADANATAAANYDAVVISRGPIRVEKDQMAWPAGMPPEDKTAFLDALGKQSTVAVV